MEGQGVTSWSSDDLRVKYRAERQREEVYQAFRLEEQVAEALAKDYGQVGGFNSSCLLSVEPQLLHPQLLPPI